MADEIIDFEGLQLNLSDYSEAALKITNLRKCNQSFCIGQLIDLRVDLPLSSDGKKKFSSVQGPRSPVAQNLLTVLRRQLSAGIEVKCNLRGIPDTDETKRVTQNKTPWADCNVKSSYHETCSHDNKKTDSHLSKDRDVYHVPVQVRVPEMASSSHHVELIVHAKPVSKQGPSWLSSPTRQEPSLLSGSTVGEPEPLKGKKVCEKLKIIHPPCVQFQQKNVAGKQMIFLQVKNISTYSIKVDDCSILPEACPKTSSSQSCGNCKSGAGDQRTVCVLHGNMVKAVVGESRLFPIDLMPGECVSICYALNTSSCVDNLTKDDLCLEAHVRWCIPKNVPHENSTAKPVVTTYRLPVLRIKKAYFVMCATCDTDEVKKGDSFVVTYSITNKLQDFLSIKLHWKPILIDGSAEAARNLENIEQGLVCQDPSIQLGPCVYGSTVQAQVRFQSLRSGLYEVCKHLKINLRYLVPSSETASLASPSSQTSTLSDDHLAVASEELWRSRSGSGSSFHDPRVASAEERRLSFANKSYSFGDLGPTKSSESADIVCKDKPKHFDRSPGAMKKDFRSQIPPGGRYEQMLLCPENFIKNSCLVYVK